MVVSKNRRQTVLTHIGFFSLMSLRARPTNKTLTVLDLGTDDLLFEPFAALRALTGKTDLLYWQVKFQYSSQESSDDQRPQTIDRLGFPFRIARIQRLQQFEFATAAARAARRHNDAHRVLGTSAGRNNR